MWNTRLPQPGAKVLSGRSSSAAEDGLEGRLIYPKNRPDSEWGPRYATQIQSDDFALYGSYAARIRSGSGRGGEGVISAFFTYFNDETDWDGDGLIDNHEIDVELSAVERGIVYVAVWTDYEYVDDEEHFRRVGARINLRNGRVWATPEGGEDAWDLVRTDDLPFSDSSFNHGRYYYTYGFDWAEESVVFWIDLEDGAGPREIFEVTGAPGDRIPSLPSQTFTNVWHNPVNWWTRADAPSPTRNAVMRIDWLTAP